VDGGEFLQWEPRQIDRHELCAGQIRPKLGETDIHVTVCLNLAMALRQHLAGSPCRTYMSDMKLQAQEGESYFYPDVLVTCSSADRSSPRIKREPLLLAEVLSPSTAAYDRGEKFARYRQIASLQEVALIDLDHRRVDVFRKNEGDGLWVLHPFAPGEAVTLGSVHLTLSAATLFAEIDDDTPDSLN
jgi:Uma2 family endonuclease